MSPATQSISWWRSVRVADLDDAARAELEGPLVDIVSQWFRGPTREEMARYAVFRDPGARLLLFYADSGELLGFSSIAVHPHELDGRRYAVFDVGSYLANSVRRGGTKLARVTLLELLRLSLSWPNLTREPVLVGYATTPAGYALALRECPFVHPRPGVPVSGEAEALVSRVAEERGFTQVDTDAWVVRHRTQIRVREPERVSDSPRMASDAGARFFERRNPGWSRGDWLMVHIPLSLPALVLSRFPQLARSCAARFG